MTLGEQIKKARIARGISTYALRKQGISDHLPYKIEKDENVELDTIKAYLAAIDPDLKLVLFDPNSL